MTATSITAQEYSAHLDGFAVIDCTVRNKDIYYFVAREQGSGANPAINEHWALKRVLPYMRHRPEGERWSHAEFQGMNRLFAGSSVEPLSQFVGVDRECAVYVLGSGQDRLENPIATGPVGPLRGAPRKVRTIDGYAYAVSGGRGLCKRLGPDRWLSLCPPVTIDPKSAREEYELTKDWGFSDVDGFSATDIYMVGGVGDLWHYDGAGFRQVALKTDMYLETVCCAGNGTVYIGAQSGTLIAGRGHHWRLVQRGGMSLPYTDLVWHDGALYGTNDYGLWRLHGDRMEPVDLPDEVRVCCGHLSAHDGVMLMAGVHGAAYLEGGRWTLLFNALRQAA